MEWWWWWLYTHSIYRISFTLVTYNVNTRSINAKKEEEKKEIQTIQTSGRYLFTTTTITIPKKKKKKYLERTHVAISFSHSWTVCLDALFCVVVCCHYFYIPLLSCIVATICFDSRAKESTSPSSWSSATVVVARSARYEINLNTFRTDYGNVSEQFIVMLLLCCSCNYIRTM